MLPESKVMPNMEENVAALPMPSMYPLDVPFIPPPASVVTDTLFVDKFIAVMMFVLAMYSISSVLPTTIGPPPLAMLTIVETSRVERKITRIPLPSET
jgi:hypothetical protein